MALEANMGKKIIKPVKKGKVTASLPERWKKRQFHQCQNHLDILRKYEENSKGFSLWLPPERCAIKRIALF